MVWARQFSSMWGWRRQGVVEHTVEWVEVRKWRKHLYMSFWGQLGWKGSIYRDGGVVRGGNGAKVLILMSSAPMFF